MCCAFSTWLRTQCSTIAAGSCSSSSLHQRRKFLTSSVRAALLFHFILIRVFAPIFIRASLASSPPPLISAAMTGPFDARLARTYFHKIISGLGACHAANIVHRDMKLENLLLNDSFDLKLADFGMATVITIDNAMRTTRCGTDAYMAPELLALPAGQAYDAKAVDVFAAGCILFIMLVGGALLFFDPSRVVLLLFALPVVTCFGYFTAIFRLVLLCRVAVSCCYVYFAPCSASVWSRLDGRLVVRGARQRTPRRLLGRARAPGADSRSAVRRARRGQAAAAVHAERRPGRAHAGAGHSRRCVHRRRTIRVRGCFPPNPPKFLSACLILGRS